jgi:MFS family permease
MRALAAAHRAQQVEDLLLLFQPLRGMAEVGHDLLDGVFHAVELGEGRVDLDDLVGERCATGAGRCGVDALRLADGLEHALGGGGVGQRVALALGEVVLQRQLFLARALVAGGEVADHVHADATLPVTGYVVGAALSAMPVARLQARLGRKRSFQIGLLVAMVTRPVRAGGQLAQLLAAGGSTLVAGFYSANGALYRFAGPNWWRPRSRSAPSAWVLAGGIAGAFIGPNLASASRDWLAVPFAGAYLALVGVALLSLLALSFIQFAPHVAAGAGGFARAALGGNAAAAGLRRGHRGGGAGLWRDEPADGGHADRHAAVPAPLRERGAGAGVARAGHVRAELLHRHLIKRFGVLPVMLVGVLLNLVCVAVALSGVDLMEFLVALFALGVGWNFLYTGGTTLFTQSYRPEEKNRAQGVMDSCVFGTMALSSFSSGALITTQGWRWLNLGSLVPIVLVMAALLWLAAQRAGALSCLKRRAFPAGRSVLPASRRRSRSRLLRRGVCAA